jgi:hypothetical protein
MIRASLLAFLVLLTGCGPSLYLASAAPPGRVVRGAENPNHIDVSEGVAVAVECVKFGGGACREATATTADPTIARVLRGHISGLSRSYDGTGNSSSFVVVGVTPGRTKLSVVEDGHLTRYDVNVLAVAP